MNRQAPLPLLPAPDAVAGDSSVARNTPRGPAQPPQQSLAWQQQKRRALNKFACKMCQKKKTKCDGARPFCTACLRRKDDKCEYPVREGAVSRYADLKQTYQQLEQENHQLKDLFGHLRNRPENEAFEIYRRLRNSDDPFKTLQQFRDAETLLMLPTSNSLGTNDGSINRLDAEAFAKSPIQVTARPWTSVAGNGIVSSLISAFFKWDDALIFGFIDRELFLGDMRRGDPLTARYCSPLLVNSICALRSVLSEQVKRVHQITGKDFAAAFLAEAKKHLNEEISRTTITTVQGLYVLLALSCCDGTSRTGTMYRFAALETLRRLKPERVFKTLDPAIPEDAARRRALSKLCYGLFIYERIFDENIQAPPALSPPTIPHIYDEGDLVDFNLDVRGHAFVPGSPLPPIVPGVARATAEAACLIYDVTLYNLDPAGPIGEPKDVHRRAEFLTRLNTMEASFSRRLGYIENPAPGTLFLKLFTNMAAFSVLRQLRLDTSIPYDPPTTARALLIRFCTMDANVMESYVRHYGLAEYSPMIFIGIWNVTFTLVTMLPSRNPSPIRRGDEMLIVETIVDLFTRACGIMSVLARDMPSIRLVMQGLLALANKMGRVIPVAARQYFDDLERGKEQLKDVPIKTVLPVQEVEETELSVLLEGWSLTE